MFEALDEWRELWPERPILRRVDPPQAVVVDWPRAMNLAYGARRADRVPMRVRASGVELGHQVPATLCCWVQCSDGQWLGGVSTTFPTRGSVNSLSAEMWVPAHALSPF